MSKEKETKMSNVDYYIERVNKLITTSKFLGLDGTFPKAETTQRVLSLKSKTVDFTTEEIRDLTVDISNEERNMYGIKALSEMSILYDSYKSNKKAQKDPLLKWIESAMKNMNGEIKLRGYPDMTTYRMEETLARVYLYKQYMERNYA